MNDLNNIRDKIKPLEYSFTGQGLAERIWRTSLFNCLFKNCFLPSYAINDVITEAIIQSMKGNHE